MAISNERSGQTRPASSVERELLMDGRGTRDDFPDPFGEHDIEWWVWDGDRLIPATTDALREIEEYERSRAAIRRLEERERIERTLRRRASRRLSAVVRVFRVVRVWRRGGSHTFEAPAQQPASSEQRDQTP